MLNPISLIWRIVTVSYRPQTEDRSFLTRSETKSEANLTGEPYFTDGLRAVVVLSKTRTQSAYFEWA